MEHGLKSIFNLVLFSWFFLTKPQFGAYLMNIMNIVFIRLKVLKTNLSPFMIGL
jgi:hypothetical protein